MAIKVNKGKCTGCGDCVDVCPVEAISVENGKVVIDKECIECGACVNMCKNEVLSLH
jgi:ferredoxin